MGIRVPRQSLLSGGFAQVASRPYHLSKLKDFSKGDPQVSIARPKAVYVLLNGGYVEHNFQDKKVGEVELTFSDGPTFNVRIIAWQNIREAWAYENDTSADSVSPTGEIVQRENVWAESQSRGKPVNVDGLEPKNAIFRDLTQVRGS